MRLCSIKSAGALDGQRPYLSFMQTMSRFGWNNLGFMQAISFYERISPVATMVDLVAESIGQLTPVLIDKRTNETVEGSDVMSLLENPNATEGYTSFMESLASFYLITGNVYIEAVGGKNYEPHELYVIPPQHVNVLADTHDGMAGRMIVNYNMRNNNITYNRYESFGQRFRYYDNLEIKELWQIRRFNPQFGAGSLYGQSKFLNSFYEIELFEQSRIHNYAILRNGSRPSGIVMNPNSMDDKSYERVRKELNSDNAGAENAGKIFMVEGLGSEGFNFQQLSLNNKDMEFMALNKDCIERLCNRGGVPLPLVMQDSATYNNVENSVLFLYDNTTLPVANKIFEELSQMLLPRFGLSTDDYAITYDKEDVTALKTRTMRQLKEKKDLGVVTFNEIRAELGYESIGAEGDSLVPSGSTNVTAPNDVYTGAEVATAGNGLKSIKGKVADIINKAVR